MGAALTLTVGTFKYKFSTSPRANFRVKLCAFIFYDNNDDYLFALYPLHRRRNVAHPEGVIVP